MRKTLKYYDRLNIQILTVLILLLLAVGLIVSAFNLANVRSVYERSYTEKVLLINGMMASLIDGEDVRYYVELMERQDSEFKQNQKQFNYDREELFFLSQNGSSEEEISSILTRMQRFYVKMTAFKGQDYQNTLQELKRLKEISGVKYVYIFSDTGVTDNDGNKLHTCIFDAEDSGTIDRLDIDSLGTVLKCEKEAAEIYSTKKAWNKALYSKLDRSDLEYGSNFVRKHPDIWCGCYIVVHPYYFGNMCPWVVVRIVFWIDVCFDQLVYGFDGSSRCSSRPIARFSTGDVSNNFYSEAVDSVFYMACIQSNR